VIPASIGRDDVEPYFDDLGLRWRDPVTMQNAEPAHSHAMRTPFDRWDMDAKPFPAISIKVERMPFSEDGSYVDVLDIVVWPVKNSNDRF